LVQKVFLSESQFFPEQQYDNVLQTYHKNIIDFKAKTAQQHHSAFTGWYNKLSGTGFAVFDIILVTNDTWNDACKRPANINSTTKKQLESFCLKINNYIFNIKVSKLSRFTTAILTDFKNMEYDMNTVYSETVDNLYDHFALYHAVRFMAIKFVSYRFSPKFWT
jgi:hypothetical protein